MIPERLSKKLTFLIIPEPNRQVRRLRIPVILLYALPIAIVALAGAATVMAVQQSASLQTNAAMKAEWTAEVGAQARTLREKDDEIAKLQEELLQLAQQAETVAARMAELETLEREILAVTEADNEDGSALRPTAEASPSPGLVRILGTEISSVALRSDEIGTPTDIAWPASHAAPTSIAAVAAYQPAGAAGGAPKTSIPSAGVGGQYMPVNTEETLRMSEAASRSYEEVARKADRLEDALQQALQEAEKLAYLRSITPTIYPTTSTRITSSFGYRRDPFTRRTAYHKGIDFGGDIGDPIFATADGSVKEAGYERAMGNYIVLGHGNGITTVYMHLSKKLVKEGQNVKKGEKIGALGSTGRSTGPHLHYEIHKNGEAINPKPYIKDQEG